MNHSSRHLRNRESGVALVAALAMLFTAGLLVTALVAVSQTSTQGIYTQTELMRSGYIAEGAGNRIRYLIEADRPAAPRMSTSTNTITTATSRTTPNI